MAYSRTLRGGVIGNKNMVKFTQRFEMHKEVIRAVYLPKKLHLTIFYDENFDEVEVKRIVLEEIDISNLQNSVETLSFYAEIKERGSILPNTKGIGYS